MYLFICYSKNLSKTIEGHFKEAHKRPDDELFVAIKRTQKLYPTETFSFLLIFVLFLWKEMIEMELEFCELTSDVRYVATYVLRKLRWENEILMIVVRL